MPSSFTTGLGLEKPANGEQDSSWGDTINANMDRIDTGAAWQVVQTQVGSSQVASLTFAIPPRYLKAALEFSDLSPATASVPYLRVSVDGGGSFLSGNSDYTVQRSTSRDSFVGAAFQQASYAGLTSDSDTAPAIGSLVMQTTGSKLFRGTLALARSSAGLTMTDFAGIVVPAGTVTHVLVGFVGVNVSTYRIRLLGAVS